MSSPKWEGNLFDERLLRALKARQNTIAEVKLKKALEKMIGNWQIQGFTIFYDTLTFCRQKPQTFELEKKGKVPCGFNFNLIQFHLSLL